MNESRCRRCAHGILPSQIDSSLESPANSTEERLHSETLHCAYKPTDGTLYLICSHCSEVYCRECVLAFDHNCPTSSEVSNAPSKLLLICQECEESPVSLYCDSCEQYLCGKCSFKIHNKGKRAKHQLEEVMDSVTDVRLVIGITTGIMKCLRGKDGLSLSEGEIIEFTKGINLTANKNSGHMNIVWRDMTNMTNIVSEISKHITIMLPDYEGKDWNNETKEWLTMQFSRYPLMKQFYLPRTAEWRMIAQHIQEFIKGHEDGKGEGMHVTHQWLKIEEYGLIEENEVKDQPKKDAENTTRTRANELDTECLSPKVVNEPVLFSHRVNAISEYFVLPSHHEKQVSNCSNISAISMAHSAISEEASELFSGNSSTLNLDHHSILTFPISESLIIPSTKSESLLNCENCDSTSNQSHSLCNISQEFSQEHSNSHLSLVLNDRRANNANKKSQTIPYFQPYHSSIPQERTLRELASHGTIIIPKDEGQEFLNSPEKICHFVTRIVSDMEIDYVAYTIDYITVESLTWVIESIKQDRMEPNEKLILSRIKESFLFKLSSKLWKAIVHYLKSGLYENDCEENDKLRKLPRMQVRMVDEDLLVEFEGRSWVYEDQSTLNEEEQEWGQFKELLTNYFSKRTEIVGGRYGCVQYVKQKGPKPLRECSLGRISMYVQEAINQGFIRYHKTQLVSNRQEQPLPNTPQQETSWEKLQREVKVGFLQLALIDILLEAGPKVQIPLAQIPLNLKKTLLFDINLLELGFPKLKNLLSTLSSKLRIETNKTHISYEPLPHSIAAISEFRNQTSALSDDFLHKILTSISHIIAYYGQMDVGILYTRVNEAIGFCFDYTVFHMSDFYQFVIYYCHAIIVVHYVDGRLIAEHKRTNKEAVLRQSENVNARKWLRKWESFSEIIEHENDSKPEDEGSVEAGKSPRVTTVQHEQLNRSIEQIVNNILDVINIIYRMMEYGIVNQVIQKQESNEKKDCQQPMVGIMNCTLKRAMALPSSVTILTADTWIVSLTLKHSRDYVNGYVCGYNGVRGNHGMVDVNNCGTGYTDKGNVTGENSVNYRNKQQHIRVKTTNDTRVKHERMYSNTVTRNIEAGRALEPHR